MRVGGGPVRAASRAVTTAAVSYIVAWLVGLFVAPSVPGSTAPDTEVRAYYVDHAAAVMVQSLLIHGIAGLCLLVLAWSVPSAGRARTWARITGGAAAAVSLLQVAFAVAAVTGAESHPASTSQHWLSAINYADTVKLVLLAGFVAAVSAGLASPWLRRLAYLLVPLLGLGGAAFVFDDTAVTPALNACLVVSLPMLLVWTAALARVVRR